VVRQVLFPATKDLVQRAVSYRLTSMSRVPASGEPWRTSAGFLQHQPPRRPARTAWRSVGARKALVAAVSTSAPEDGRGSVAALLSLCDPADVVRLAIAQGVAGRASARLLPHLGPSPRAVLRASLRRDAVSHLAFVEMLRPLGAALDAAGATWAVLKGPVLAELVYGSVPRSYTDLDLLVPGAQLRRSVAALQGAGMTFVQRNWPLLARIARGQVTMADHAGQPVDLHWHFLYMRSARERFWVPTTEVLERRQRVKLGTVEAWVLEPTDAALHLSLHAALSGGHKLLWLVDIERTLAVRPPDWDLFVARCLQWRVELPVSVVLERARATLGAGVPQDVLAVLAGNGPRRFIAQELCHWVPGGLLPGGRSVTAAFTRSLRDNLAATGVAFTVEVSEALAKLAGRGEIATNDPRHLAYDAGGPDGFECYAQVAERSDQWGHIGDAELSRTLGLPATPGAKTWRRLHPSALAGALWAAYAAQTVHARLRKHGLAAKVPPPPRLGLRAGRGVRFALRRLNPTCLERALVEQAWLAATSRPRDVVIGVPPEGMKGAPAHAWLDGLEPRSSAHYLELHRLSPPAPKPRSPSA